MGFPRILPAVPVDEALAEPRGPKEKPEDTLNTEDEAADEDSPAEPKGPKEKPEGTLNTEDEAEGTFFLGRPVYFPLLSVLCEGIKKN